MLHKYLVICYILLLILILIALVLLTNIFFAKLKLIIVMYLLTVQEC